jgi:hypothetical protein
MPREAEIETVLEQILGFFDLGAPGTKVMVECENGEMEQIGGEFAELVLRADMLLNHSEEELLDEDGD